MHGRRGPRSGASPGVEGGGPETSSDACDVIVVELEGHRYGIPARAVAEVHRMVATVPLPGAPPIVEGMINVRGSMVPVLDLRARVDLGGRPAEPADHLVLVVAGGGLIGVRVDRVVDLLRVPRVDRAVNGVAPGMEGVATLEDGLLLIHDVAAFLLPEEAAAVREALLTREPEAAS